MLVQGVACVVMTVATGVRAADGTWVGTAAASYGTTNDWAGGILADGAGATMTFAGSGSPLSVNTNVTLGAIHYDPGVTAVKTFQAYVDPVQFPDPFFVTFDSGAPDTPARIWHQADYVSSGTPRQILSFPMVLKSDLLFRSSFTNEWGDNDGPAFSVYSDIREAAGGCGLIFDADHPNSQMTLFGSNSFTGPVEVRQGVLKIADRALTGGILSQLGAGTEVYVTNGLATLDLGGFSVGPEKTLYLGGMGGFGFGALANSYQVPCHTSVWHGAVHLVSHAGVGIGVGGGYFWPSAYGSTLEIAGSVSDGGKGFGLEKTKPNLLILSGANTYGGGTTISEGYVMASNVNALGTGPLIFNNGSFGFARAFDLSAVTLSNINGRAAMLDTCGWDVTLSGSVTDQLTGGLTKKGEGALTLAGANSFKGGTTVSQGSLVLDYTSEPNSKVHATSALTLSGGRLTVRGGNGYTQNVGNLTVRLGHAMVTNENDVGGTVLNFGATLNRDRGATFTFGTSGAPVNCDRGLANGLMRGCALYGASDWATWVTTNLPGYSGKTIVPYGGYSATWSSAANLDVTAANAGEVPESAEANSLRFHSAEPVTLTLSGENSLLSGGILVTPEVGANPVVIRGGTLTSKNSEADLILVQNNTLAPLVIGSCLTNNGSTKTYLTKTGPGTLAISNSASLFTGDVYVNGGTLEVFGATDLGDTNTEKTVYLNPGATLRLFGSYDLGSAAKKCHVRAETGGAVIDIPQAGDVVTVTGNLYINGTVTKRGKGTLRLASNSTGGLVTPEPHMTLVVEEGTLELAGSAELFGKQGVLVVRNGAKLLGYRLFAPRSFGRADYQDRFTLVIEEGGAVMDLEGVSRSVGNGTLPLSGISIEPNDYFEGPGKLILTNSSVAAAKYTLYRGTHTRFTGVFEVPGDYLASGSSAVFALPNGELRLGDAAVADFTGVITYCAFGALTGSGRFGGYGDQGRPPFLIGDDRAGIFEFSGTLFAWFSGAGWGNKPGTGCRFIKTGGSTWRISGATNDLRQAFTIRNGTVLTGADSTGAGLGALGTGPVWLGDAESRAGTSLALKTDGAYLIGNKIEVNTTGPEVTLTLGGNQSVGASSFTNGLLLTRDLCLHSENTDGNGVTFSGEITGPGGIVKTGPGPVYLTGTVQYAGTTTVREGDLVVQGRVTLTNALTVAAGESDSGTMVVQGDLTLGAGASLTVEPGTLDRGVRYTLLTWTGTRSGSFDAVTGLPEGWHVGYYPDHIELYYAPPGTRIELL
jgi:autotransporter-associated beta strand protein